MFQFTSEVGSGVLNQECMQLHQSSPSVKGIDQQVQNASARLAAENLFRLL